MDSLELYVPIVLAAGATESALPRWSMGTSLKIVAEFSRVATINLKISAIKMFIIYSNLFIFSKMFKMSTSSLTFKWTIKNIQ